MENENTETLNDNVETTTEQSSEETQQVETQSNEQADTTQNESTVTESMGIQASEESGETESEQPTLDDIVAEALAGELSEETQKLVDQNGLGKHLEMLVSGHQAIQEKNNQEVFGVVGGEESYKELQEWGLNNMSKEEQESFNKALFSGDMNMSKLAVEGLQARYVAANGKGPDRIIEGGGSANADSRPFSNAMEYIKETQSFEYKSNPEYRAKIEARRNNSGI